MKTGRSQIGTERSVRKTWRNCEKERRENSPETQPILQVCFSTGRMWAAQEAREVLGIHGDLDGP